MSKSLFWIAFLLYPPGVDALLSKSCLRSMCSQEPQLPVTINIATANAAKMVELNTVRHYKSPFDASTRSAWLLAESVVSS